MSRLKCILFLQVATAVALGQSTLPKPDLPETPVRRLYTRVLARRPTDIPQDGDIASLAPWLSTALLHKIDVAKACSVDWDRQNPEPKLKARKASEFGLFTGDHRKSEPWSFKIENTEAEKDGSRLVYVEFYFGTHDTRWPQWRVAAVVRQEAGRYVIDDVIYTRTSIADPPALTHFDDRLSDYLATGCNGPHWAGYSLPDQPQALTQSLYRQLAAHGDVVGIPSGIDWKILAPYFSKTLLHHFDDYEACVAEYDRLPPPPGPPQKAPFGLYEMGILTGSVDAARLTAFHIQRTQPDGDGRVRVYVKLDWQDSEPPSAKPWTSENALVLVKQDGRLVVDDVIYLRDNGDIFSRLSEDFSWVCDGPHFIQHSREMIQPNASKSPYAGVYRSSVPPYTSNRTSDDQIYPAVWRKICPLQHSLHEAISMATKGIMWSNIMRLSPPTILMRQNLG